MPTFKNNPKQPTRKGGYGMDFFKPMPNNSTKWGLVNLFARKVKAIKRPK